MDEVVSELEDLLSEALSLLDAWNTVGMVAHYVPKLGRRREMDVALFEVKDHLRNLRYGLASLRDEIQGIET